MVEVMVVVAVVTMVMGTEALEVAVAVVANMVGKTVVIVATMVDACVNQSLSNHLA